MTNPSHRLSADFSPSGATFIAGSNHWTMTLKNYGYGRRLRLAGSVTPRANANRVEYQRDGVSEWYVNGPFGLEQGFTLAHPPVKRNDSPLTLMLALSGDLSASVDPDKHALSLLRNGAPVLRYSGLKAQDAIGHQLNTWMEVDGNSLRLRIDDSHAQYPVTVDPVVQSALLTASDGAAQDGFGGSVAMSANGKVIAVGAPGANITSNNSVGAVYVFTEPATGGWTTTSAFAAKLTGSDANGCDGVGGSVSISGDGRLIVTGDACETIGTTFEQGAAYVFVEPSGGWASSTETAKLTASDGAADDFFGASVSTTSDGSLIVVSAPNVRPPRSFGPGVAYIFAKPSGGWISATQTAELIPSSSQAAIGNISVSSDGSTIAAGGNNLETVVVFVEPANGWVSSTAYTAILTASDAAANAFFGSSVSLTNNGGVIVVGAPFFGAPADDLAQGTGAAYVYLKNPIDGWQTTSNFNAELKPSDPAKGAEFGLSVAISGDGSSIVVGAPGATAGTKVFGGAFYIYAETASGWESGTETAKLNNPDVAVNDDFAASVALSAFISPIIVRPPLLTIIVGSGGTTINSNAAQGAAYIFTGYALSPIPTLSLGNASFSSPAGTTSVTQSVILTNTGTGPMNVSAEVVSAPFTSTQNCLTVSPLAPGASCTEQVAFVAGTVGTFSGTLTFTDDAGEVEGSTQQVSLSGKSVQAGTSTTISGVAPDPAFVGQAVIVSYSVVPPAGDTLMPTGNVTVQASTGESCIGTVAAGSCSITFSSAVTRTVTANYVGDTNFTSSFSSSVSEQVVDFSLSASPTSQTVPPGHLANFTLTLSSLNGFTGTVYASCGPQPPHSSCTVTPASLNLSNSTAIAQVTIDLENKGTYALTFAATNGFLIHMASVTLGVK